ncbi:hypothetical protein MPL3365_210133 [Mesorhizobium plurifarium]|uniref:Uncharacterized protein n=1 Tax=Mesorhizobium plurifarium TaxID=69974 RepID=A0A090GUB9_MESPL|nr:hypothetical protein MPL3365_210133 [Mesorhizobium plurifarium]
MASIAQRIILGPKGASLTSTGGSKMSAIASSTQFRPLCGGSNAKIQNLLNGARGALRKILDAPFRASSI